MTESKAPQPSLGVTRRTAAAGLAALGVTALSSGGAAASSVLTLMIDGAERILPERMFGFNTVVPYDVPHEDPAFVPPVKWLQPHYLRVPGGTVANFFNWRTGHLEVPDVKDGASSYRRFLVDKRMAYSHRLHPNGVRIETLKGIADQVGAELLVVPNLETSTIDEQAAWFADMTAKGVHPRLIELGNEFYLALLMDAESLRIWPNYSASMKRMKAFYDGFQRHLPADHRVAVQAAGSRFHDLARPNEEGLRQHEWDWDDALAPEPWFDAVTTHMYTTFSSPAGPEAVEGLPATYDTIYGAMLARTESGFHRNLTFLEEKLPGKEIWVTEWGGFEPRVTFDGSDIKFDGAWLNMVARGMLTMLRHPSVTVTAYHGLFFAGNLSSMFRREDGGGYEPTTASSLLRWFHEASRGPGVRYSPVTADGTKRIAAKTTLEGESFSDVDGGLFHKGNTATLLVQNTWMEARAVSLAELLNGQAPEKIEVMGSDNIKESYEQRIPPIRVLATGLEVTLPPHSIARISWS